MIELRSMARHLSLILSVAGAGAACAQGFPNKPIRLVTAEPGGASDFVSRIVAQGLTSSLGQQVIVENRGGSGVIPIEIVAKAIPDGHTLLVSGSAFWLLPYIQKVSYDPLKDFATVAVGAVSPLLLVVHPSLPVKSIKELIAMAKARPGELNYASGISGSSPHLSAELFKAMAGVNIVRVVYKGGAPALNAILGGEVQVMFATSSGAGPHVTSGRLRALAVTTAQPSTLFPALPTVAAEGLTGYEAAGMTGLFVPARTPASLINRLNDEIVKVLNRTEVKDRFLSSGYEVVNNTPVQSNATIKAEMTRMGKVIKDAGIRTE